MAQQLKMHVENNILGNTPPRYQNDGQGYGQDYGPDYRPESWVKLWAELS